MADHVRYDIIQASVDPFQSLHIWNQENYSATFLVGYMRKLKNIERSPKIKFLDWKYSRRDGCGVGASADC